MKQPRRFIAVVAAVCGLGGFAWFGFSFAQDAVQHTGGMPKLIGQADLDCSFIVLDSAPKLCISAPVESPERSMLTDSDLFFVDPVPGTGSFIEDSRWSILEMGPRVKGQSMPGVLGNIVFRRGLARVIRIEYGRAVMKVEKSCGLITMGFLLVPYEEGEILIGPELEYAFPFQKENALTGRVVFLEADSMQIEARGHWVLIDIGAEQGLQVGTQLTIYHQEGKAVPQAIGNSVVIKTGGRWATVKILNSKNVVQVGDFVQVKPI
jgi:hypothetical protein